MKVELKDKERIDDLQRNGYQIIQNPEKFCFGMDAVLLTGFAHAQFLFGDVRAEFYDRFALLEACLGIDLGHAVEGILNAVLAVCAGHSFDLKPFRCYDSV